MAEQTAAEQETHANMTADNRSMWELFIDDPVMQRRFEAAGATVVSTTPQGGKFYTIPYAQFKPRKAREKLSEEKRYQLSERLRKVRKPSVE